MTVSGERVKFDHYSVLARDDGTMWELGRGAMGVTYKAEDVNLHCRVALKVISADCFGDERMRRRFTSEARAAARVRDPHVASVYHLGNDEEHFFYAMELVEGESAETIVQRDGPLPPRTALQVTRQVAQALGAAAREQLVHRDIKPANLMIVAQALDEEDGPAVKLIDFGLARSAVPNSDATTLSHGGFVGTPQFASPEQAEERELDIRSDIYSLGCTLWYLLTGEPPFRGSMARVFAQHLHGEPPFEKLVGVPRPVVRLLDRMLRKNAAERPQDSAELRREIEQCLGSLGANEQHGAEVAAPPAIRWAGSRFASRWLAVAIAGLLGLAAFVALMTTGVAPHVVDAMSRRAESPHAPELPSPAPTPAPAVTSNTDNAALDPAPVAEGPPASDEATEIPPTILQPPAELRPELATSLMAKPPDLDGEPAPLRETSRAPVPKVPSATSGAQPPAGPSAYEKLTTEARQFVRTYLAAAEKPQPDGEVALYADQVDYFAQGRLSRKAIEADQRNYYRKWPNRDFVLLGEPEIVEIGLGEVVVKFRMKYAVRNGSQSAHGVTENTVRLKRLSSGMRITSIRERKAQT